MLSILNYAGASQTDEVMFGLMKTQFRGYFLGLQALDRLELHHVS